LGQCWRRVWADTWVAEARHKAAAVVVWSVSLMVAVGSGWMREDSGQRREENLAGQILYPVCM
jgi:hypothetical protein